MATNIWTIKTLASTLVLPARNRAAAEAMRDEMPERGPLPENGRRRRGQPADDTSKDLPLNQLRWCGDFSARTWFWNDADEDSLFERFVALLEGEGEFVVIWDDYDSITGLRIKDGKCIKTGVHMTLGIPMFGTPGQTKTEVLQRAGEREGLSTVTISYPLPSVPFAEDLDECDFDDRPL
jgi:hypothetical protein